jgi:hypothetical protein
MRMEEHDDTDKEIRRAEDWPGYAVSSVHAGWKHCFAISSKPWIFLH